MTTRTGSHKFWFLIFLKGITKKKTSYLSCVLCRGVEAWLSKPYGIQKQVNEENVEAVTYKHGSVNHFSEVFFHCDLYCLVSVKYYPVWGEKWCCSMCGDDHGNKGILGMVMKAAIRLDGCWKHDLPRGRWWGTPHILRWKTNAPLHLLSTL